MQVVPIQNGQQDLGGQSTANRLNYNPPVPLSLRVHAEMETKIPFVPLVFDVSDATSSVLSLAPHLSQFKNAGHEEIRVSKLSQGTTNAVRITTQLPFLRRQSLTCGCLAALQDF